MIDFFPTEVLSYYAVRLPDLPLHGKEARGAHVHFTAARIRTSR